MVISSSADPGSWSPIPFTTTLEEKLEYVIAKMYRMTENVNTGVSYEGQLAVDLKTEWHVR
jgi:hypothetical protein